jgi:hypothetical protein
MIRSDGAGINIPLERIAANMTHNASHAARNTGHTVVDTSWQGLCHVTLASRIT